jgi:hypothetical protein
MVFDNRPISEITEQELKDLIGKQEENLWIDFKQQDYHRDPTDSEKHKREICKDVTAMANAEGGYIFIGVDEKNKIAQDFFTIPDAAKVAQSIKGICQQYIDPPILNLEVERYPYSLQWKNTNIELVTIHIPPSERKPHGFRSRGTINFVKRDGDATREYPITELIQDLLVSYNPPIMSQIDSKLTSILRNTRVERRNSISPQDDPLEQMEVENLLHLMKLRFDETIAEQPYYRILAVPQELNSDKVDTRSGDIRKIMYNPPDRRYGNFGVTGILEREKLSSYEGISGPNVTGGEITLLKNGFLEVRCPLRDTQFQWRREESTISTDWLYPYAVCEFPVTFLRLVKEIYEASGIDSKVFIQQEYHNLTGFMLVGGSPVSNAFGIFQDGRCVYESSRPIISKRTVDPNFIPDHIAYDLIKDVYDSFGFNEKWIPAFDENGNFILQ